LTEMQIYQFQVLF